MLRKALVVGIDHYGRLGKLGACVNDAKAMALLLSKHADGLGNYDVRLLFSTPKGHEIHEGEMSPEVLEARSAEARVKGPISADVLRDEVTRFLGDGSGSGFSGDAVLYFAGHGEPTFYDGLLLTPLVLGQDRGLQMSELLMRAQSSGLRDLKIILDCCHAGLFGQIPLAFRGRTPLSQVAQLGRGLTIMAAAGADEAAEEVGEHGLFTGALVAGLDGLAADVRGGVTAASLFAYARPLFSAHKQQPVFKSHVDDVVMMRRCAPRIADDLLLALPSIFDAAPRGGPSPYRLDPGHEWTLDTKKRKEQQRQLAALLKSPPKVTDDKVARFNQLAKLRDAGMIRLCPLPKKIDHAPALYWWAIHSGEVELTELGKFYWQLARDGRMKPVS